MDAFVNEYKDLLYIVGIGLLIWAILRIKDHFKTASIKTEEPEDKNQKFFLRRISDWWVPTIFTPIYLVLNSVIVMLPITVEAASGLQGMLFRILVISFALPIARYVILIFFPLMDEYTDKEKMVDWDNMLPNQRIWVYIGLVSLLVYLVAK